MTRARSVLAVGFLIALVRCTTYGAEPEGASPPERDAAAGHDAGDGGGSIGTDGGGTIDANADSGSDPNGDASVGDAAPPCALAKEGDACTQASACCSGKCGEARKCVTSCKSASSLCTPVSTSECCIGLWCNGTCAACIPSGLPAALGGSGIPLAQSCCSRAFKTALPGVCE